MELPCGWTLSLLRAWKEGAECLCFKTPKNCITVLHYMQQQCKGQFGTLVALLYKRENKGFVSLMRKQLQEKALSKKPLVKNEL